MSLPVFVLGESVRRILRDLPVRVADMGTPDASGEACGVAPTPRPLGPKLTETLRVKPPIFLLLGHGDCGPVLNSSAHPRTPGRLPVFERVPL